MIVQFVQFESALSLEEIMVIAEERAPRFRAIPGLVQKYYLKLDKPNYYGGLYVWRDHEALQAFRGSELAKTIPSSYSVIGAPDVDTHELLFPLRDMVPSEEEIQAA